MWSELTWFMWSDFVWKWSEVKLVTLKFFGTKVPCTLGWPYTEGPWLYWDYFIWYVSCTVVVFNLFCNVCMCVCGYCNMCVCVCVGVLVICVLVFTVCYIICTVCTKWEDRGRIFFFVKFPNMKFYKNVQCESPCAIRKNGPKYTKRLTDGTQHRTVNK